MAANKPHDSSSHGRWRYDVFLSFRGEDTRRNFTDHLYIALQNAGIHVFRDDNELPVGENISTELLEAIQNSRISIIVFSRDYAASSWCLEELVKIMKCRETVQQVVQPVFYKVDPSNVRKQSDSFAKAFAQHEKRFTTEKEKVLRWRNALTEAANLKGFHCTVDRHEGEFIKEIVDEILNHVNNTYLNEAIYPVGLESRVREVKTFAKLVLGIEIEKRNEISWSNWENRRLTEAQAYMGKKTTRGVMYEKEDGFCDWRSGLSLVVMAMVFSDALGWYFFCDWLFGLSLIFSDALGCLETLHPRVLILWVQLGVYLA